jgi:Thioredoxin
LSASVPLACIGRRRCASCLLYLFQSRLARHSLLRDQRQGCIAPAPEQCWHVPRTPLLQQRVRSPLFLRSVRVYWFHGASDCSVACCRRTCCSTPYLCVLVRYCPTVHLRGAAIEVTDSTFQEKVLDSDLPVVVDFWAPWCGPCRMIAPIIDQIADSMEGQVICVRLKPSFVENVLLPVC